MRGASDQGKQLLDCMTPTTSSQLSLLVLLNVFVSILYYAKGVDLPFPIQDAADRWVYKRWLHAVLYAYI